MRNINADYFKAYVRAEDQETYDKVEVLDMIDEQPTSDGWTPCSVALPEEHKTVLATVADEYGNDVMLAWHDLNGWQSGHEENLPILAWLPLPEPYRGEA